MQAAAAIFIGLIARRKKVPKKLDYRKTVERLAAAVNKIANRDKILVYLIL